MDILILITGSLAESLKLLNRMSPYLLFGFFFAGLLHIFLKVEMVARHLGKGDIASVVKAAIFGIPLPLCSCGVIPTALMLKDRGASRGAVLSFLISTPTSGVDSIAATYSLLGPLFAGYRVIASGLIGTFAGMMENLIGTKESHKEAELTGECMVCNTEDPHRHTLSEKIRVAFSYAFVKLLGDIGKWLIIGILAGGFITYLIPDDIIKTYLGSGWQAMVVMLVIGIPIYVCASGSIPIVAALIAKGMSPGAGLVFLLAGPATNVASLLVLGHSLGLRTIIIYLLSIALGCVGLGWLLDVVWGHLSAADSIPLHGKMLPYGLQITSSILLLALIGYTWIKPVRGPHPLSRG